MVIKFAIRMTYYSGYICTRTTKRTHLRLYRSRTDYGAQYDRTSLLAT